MQLLTTLRIAAIAIVFQTASVSASDMVNALDVEVTPLCGKLSDRFTTCGVLGGNKAPFTCANTGKCQQGTNLCIPTGAVVNGRQAFGEIKFPVDDWNKKFFFFEDLTKDDQEAKKIKQEEQDCYVLYSCATRCVLAGGRMKCQATNNVIGRLQVTKYTSTDEECAADEPAAPDQPANPDDPALLDDPNAALIGLGPAL